MVTPEHCRLMARYNRWMNEKLYTLCATLSDAERKKDRRAFFRSIHGTLNHLLLGDRIWLGRFLGQPFHVESLAQELYSDFDELRGERARTDDAIDAFVAGLTRKKLEAGFAYRTLVDPQERSAPLWILTTHLFNHQTHHRGQLTTLLSQCGLDPGITDLMWLPDPTDASGHGRPGGAHRGQ
ncbi:MAG TPA: damage-inducible protein DinB [Deltaproteobacteria bacterium]|nr:damage-inducible protein DinB [Deltaproteobacteria bacterium]